MVSDKIEAQDYVHEVDTGSFESAEVDRCYARISLPCIACYFEIDLPVWAEGTSRYGEVEMENRR